MKKVLSVMLAAFLLLSAGTASVGAIGQEVEINVGEFSEDGVMKGDINKDGTVDFKDAYLLAVACAKSDDSILKDFDRADCNNDKVVDLKDVVFLVKDYLAKK